MVTGASQGIGAATAIALGKRGAHVLAAARNAGKLANVVRQIQNDGGRGDFVVADLEQADAATRLFAAVDDLGDVDGLVCCAATFHRATIRASDSKMWRSIMSVNLDAVWECGREAFVRMQDSSRGGRILNIGSLSGVSGTEKFPGLAAYNTSKYGVVGLTEALAVEGETCRISAVCISPGAVSTDMLRAANPEMKARLSPEELGRLIAYLLDGSQFKALNGANIPLFSNA